MPHKFQWIYNLWKRVTNLIVIEVNHFCWALIASELELTQKNKTFLRSEALVCLWVQSSLSLSEESMNIELRAAVFAACLQCCCVVVQLRCWASVLAKPKSNWTDRTPAIGNQHIAHKFVDSFFAVVGFASHTSETSREDTNWITLSPDIRRTHSGPSLLTLTRCSVR